MSDNFVHLHLHSQYSLLDGAIKFENLVDRVNEFDMGAVAVTDHGNLFGAYQFYKTATDAGVKPIIGCEIYITPTLKLDKPSDGETFHLTVLCMNEVGYKNLSRLVTKGYLEGFYRKPRVDHELVDIHNEGLIVLSGCMSSEISQALLSRDKKEATAIASKYHEIFGDRYYLEVQATGTKEQDFLNKDLKEISDELGIPLIATNDCHYLRQEDERLHDALLCIQTGKFLKEEKRLKFQNDQFFVKSKEQMQDTLKGFDEALEKTVEVANRCDFKFKTFKTEGVYKFPDFKPPKGMTLDDHITTLSHQNLDELISTRSIADNQIDEYKQRLDHELEIICQMRFSAYFLIVADFINYARSKDIPVGPGRGSAVGSLVAYALGITDVDPIPYDLLFERFLNPERISMPDIDVDFCAEGRDQVIEYVIEKYGKDKVAQIGTFGTMSSKAVIKDVGRVLEIPYLRVNEVSKLIPSFRGKPISVEEALKKVPEIKSMVKEVPEHQELMHLAKPLENMVRHASAHASGIVISNEPLSDYIPLYKGSKNETLTQFDMNCLEELGYVKFDFLGLKTLTIIDNAVKCINESLTDPAQRIDIKKIPLDDRKVYELLVSGNTQGVFQIESSGMKDLLKRLKPSAFEDIIPLVALFRPGPLDSGMVDDFVKIKNGRKKIKYPHPDLENILKDTYGLFVYQEQIMQTASKIAGYTLEEADLLRRAMGKKKPQEMKKQRDRFVTGAIDRGISERKATELFDTMEKFAEYSFNKSHSTAYALITYQTAYIKAYYPVEFMASLMTNESQNIKKIIPCINECRQMNIKVLGPDVNESKSGFMPVAGRIRFGLSAIKHVGKIPVKEIVESREKDGPYKSIFDFCSRVDRKKVGKKPLVSLIKSGAFDSLEPNRAKLFHSSEKLIMFNALKHKSSIEGQNSLFEMDSTQPPVDLADVEEWDERTMLENEKDALDFFVTSHPTLIYSSDLERYARTSGNDSETISTHKSKKKITIAGIIRSLDIKQSKNGKGSYGNMVLEDIKGLVDVIVFNDTLRDFGHILKERFEPIVVEGLVDPGEEDEEDADQVKNKKNTGVKIKAISVYLLESIKSKSSLLHVSLEEKDSDQSVMKNLKHVFNFNPGSCKIHLHINSNGGEVVIEVGNCTVSADETLISEIENIIGKGRVSLS